MHFILTSWFRAYIVCRSKWFHIGVGGVVPAGNQNLVAAKLSSTTLSLIGDVNVVICLFLELF